MSLFSSSVRRVHVLGLPVLSLSWQGTAGAIPSLGQQEQVGWPLHTIWPLNGPGAEVGVTWDAARGAGRSVRGCGYSLGSRSGRVAGPEAGAAGSPRSLGLETERGQDRGRWLLTSLALLPPEGWCLAVGQFVQHLSYPWTRPPRPAFLAGQEDTLLPALFPTFLGIRKFLLPHHAASNALSVPSPSYLPVPVLSGPCPSGGLTMGQRAGLLIGAAVPLQPPAVPELSWLPGGRP